MNFLNEQQLGNLCGALRLCGEDSGSHGAQILLHTFRIGSKSCSAVRHGAVPAQSVHRLDTGLQMAVLGSFSRGDVPPEGGSLRRPYRAASTWPAPR